MIGSSGMATGAVLRDDRDLVSLSLNNIRADGSDRIFDVQLMIRDDPMEPPKAFLVGTGHREPLAGLDSLLNQLAKAVVGEISAMRHDPISDGVSLELKAVGPEIRDGFWVVLWLDLNRVSPATRLRASKGVHQAGLRFITTREHLEEFRSSLFDLAFEGPSVQ